MLAFVAIFLTVLTLYWFLVASKHPAGFPPGPGWALPLLGNAADIGTNLMEGFGNLRKKYGSVYGLFVGQERTIVVSDFDLIQEVGSNLDFVNRQFFTASADEIRGGLVKSGDGVSIGGIVLSNGPTWVEQRRYALHTLRDLGFGKNSMDDRINEEVDQFCRHLEKTEGKPVDVRYDFNLSVLNSLWAIVLNDRLDYDDPKLKNLVILMDKTFQELANPLNLIVFTSYRFLFKFVASLEILNGTIVVRELLSFLRGAINEHEETFQEDSLRDFTDHYLKEIQKRSSLPEESSFKGPDGRTNLLACLVDFFIAGSETTSTTLNWAVLYMILNPDVQEKVQEELDAVTGGGRLPTMADRQDTPYTEAVIHELQRCANILPFSVTHVAARDTRLGGYFVPKDTAVFPDLGHVMKDPKTFPEPEKFDPTRFLTKDGKFDPHPHVIPFGVGRRRCLGETLARTSLYLFFTGILSRFTLKKASEEERPSTEPKSGATNSPRPYKARFVLRK